MRNTWLHRFALFTAVNTWVLIFIGGLVTSTGSGLSVPDWPTTYGHNMFTYPVDQWIGGIKYEHGHRLFASYVGLLTVILSLWLALKEERRWVKVAGFAALAAVIVQGLLGGLTVLFLLPTPISVAHGMLAQSFLCLTASVALFTSPWWRSESVTARKREGYVIQMLTLIATLALFIQLAFGALMRHTSSGLAVPDFPFAYGQFFPSLSPEAMTQYNRELLTDGVKWPGDLPVQAYQITIHLMHRYWAYVVSFLVVLSGYNIVRSAWLPNVIRRNGRILIFAVIVQFLLGIFTVLTRKEVLITTAHVAMGALTLVVCVLTTLQLAKIFNFRISKEYFQE
jgi:cytochrome c oxidase assembly protein subunit 15